MNALILCLVSACALWLTGCGANADTADSNANGGNQAQSANTAQSEAGEFDHNKINISPSTWFIAPGTGNGFMAKAISGSDHVKGLTTDNGQGGVIVDAENLTPQSINAAKDALGQSRPIAIDTSAGTPESQDKLVDALRAIIGGGGNFLLENGQRPDGFVVVQYGKGAYGVTPLMPDTATVNPNGADNRVSSILGLRKPEPLTAIYTAPTNMSTTMDEPIPGATSKQ